MSDIPYLQTTAVQCGTKFIIDQAIKDSVITPGSMGYMSFALGAECNCPNVMYYNTVLIRKGQKGKLRVEQSMLLAPIYHLPNVPIEFTIPANDERKHCVDIRPLQLNTEDLKNSGPGISAAVLNERQFNFLGFALAKGLFLQELDAAAKPIDHPLVKKLNLGESPRQKVFSSRKKTTFQYLISDVETLVRENRLDSINESFWHPAVQPGIISDIRNVEVTLALPALEYSRKVNTVKLAALEYIINQLKADGGKSLPNKDQLLKAAEITEKAVIESTEHLTSKIEARLKHIIKNRELVRDEVPNNGKLNLSASDKKVTHVFSSNQG